MAEHAMKVKLISSNISSTWLEMELIEGKNREIRKICFELEWDVHRLIRTNYGEFSLGRLEKGKIEEVIGADLRKRLTGIQLIDSIKYYLS